MKFAAVILLACVAASSAAFTGNLVEQAEPAVAKACFAMRLAVGSNSDKVLQGLISNVISSLKDTIMEHIQNLQSQLLAAVPAVQAHIEGQISALQAQLAALQNNVVGNIGDVLANIMNILTQGNKAASLASILGQYNELATTIQLQIATIQSQVETFMRPENIQQMLMTIIDQIVPNQWKPAVLNAFGLNVNNKGWLTDMIGGWIGGVWDGITNVINQNVSELVNQLNNLVDQAQNGATQAMVQLNNVVATISAMIAEGKVVISASMAYAMEEILEPVKEQLGETGKELLAQLAAIIAGEVKL